MDFMARAGYHIYYQLNKEEKKKKERKRRRGTPASTGKTYDDDDDDDLLFLIFCFQNYRLTPAFQWQVFAGMAARLPASALVVNLDALTHNITRLRSRCAPHTKVIGVVKVWIQSVHERKEKKKKKSKDGKKEQEERTQCK